MDQIQRDKIAAKLKKIKALAERGVGGEKETAMRMYEDLKARYELEDEEIMLDAVTLHWFGYADELEERVLRWIFYKVTGDASYHIYTGKYSRRKKRGCDCTEIEAAEITLLYNFYKEELKGICTQADKGSHKQWLCPGHGAFILDGSYRRPEPGRKKPGHGSGNEDT